MGILDSVKGLFSKGKGAVDADKLKDTAGDVKDKVDDLVAEHSDKIPDSVEKTYDKVSDAAEKVIPGDDKPAE
jgi:hypothetical protein